MRTLEAWSRNEGLVPERLQRRLGEATVLVAGVGGVGGRCAEVLARMGVGRLLLADPDVFTVTNLNRQAACTQETLGANKAEAVAELCLSVSPGIQVEVHREGITPGNADELVAAADAVLDGTDYTQPRLGLSLARAAQAHGVPVVITVEIAFGGWVTTIPPDGRHRFERLLGLPPGVQETDDLIVPLWRWIGRLPRYVDTDALARVQTGDLEAPAVAPAVELTAALGATAILDILAGRRTVTAPRVRHLDVRTGNSSTYKASYPRFLLSAAAAKYLPQR